MILTFLCSATLSEATYSLSLDKKTITLSGSRETVTKSIVQKSKLHTEYTKAIIEEGIIAIGDYAFHDCSSMRGIEIGSMVSSVGDCAFSGCSSLQSITFPSAITTIGKNVLEECTSLKSVTFSSGLGTLGKTPFYRSDYVESINIQFNSNFSVINNSLLILNDYSLFTVATKGPTIRIPPNITIIMDSAFYYMTKITEIIFDEGSQLTDVKSNAFGYCGVQNITFPEGTLNLMKSIFYLSSIRHISFPSSLIFVDPTIVDRASSLKTVHVAPGCVALSADENGVLYTSYRKSILFMPSNIEQLNISQNTTSITTSLLQSKTKLKILDVNESNERYCSYNNTLYVNNYQILEACIGGVTHVSVHRNCVTLAASSFAFTIVEVITFEGSNLTTLSGNAFSSAKKLTGLTLPDSITTIQHYVVYGVTFREISLPSSVTSIGSHFMTGSLIEEIDMSKCVNLTTISAMALCKGNYLKSIKFPPNLKILDTQSLMGLSRLIEVTLPKSLAKINSEVFKDSGIEIVEIENESQLESIGAFAFENSKLRSFVLPDSVIDISEFAFSGCQNLINFTINPKSKLATLNPNIFKGCALTNLTLGNNLEIIRECALAGCQTLNDVYIHSGNKHFKSINGSIYSNDLDIFIVCPCGKKEIVLLETVLKLEGSAFYECASLEKVNFGSNEYLTEIGPSTFYGCSCLTSITLPIGLNNVQAQCFSECKKLEYVNFIEGCNTLSIGNESFRGCISLQFFDLRKCMNLTSINQSAFSGCTSLISIDLPSSLAYVGSLTFNGCTKLTQISYCSNSLFNETSVFNGCPISMIIRVSITYPSVTFCGRQVTRIFDTDCRVPSFQFTKDLSCERYALFSFSITFPADDK